VLFFLLLVLPLYCFLPFAANKSCSNVRLTLVIWRELKLKFKKCIFLILWYLEAELISETALVRFVKRDVIFELSLTFSLTLPTRSHVVDHQEGCKLLISVAANFNHADGVH